MSCHSFIALLFSGKTAFDASETEALQAKLDHMETTKAKIAESKFSEAVIEKMGDFIDKAEDDFMKSEVHIAITGQSGAGKSSLINTLRSLRARDPDAAPTDVRECTMTPTPYPFPLNKNIVLWDLPGVGTENFPVAGYVEKVGLTRFQALIICSCTRFKESDLWLANQARANKVRFYIIRTKVDQDVQNGLDDEGLSPGAPEASEVDQQIVKRIRQGTKQQLDAHDLPVDRVFILSTRMAHQTKWEFPGLNYELAENTPQKDKRALLMMMVTCSMDIIDRKREALEDRIDSVATQAARAPEAEYRQMILNEVTHYKTWFGLTEENLQRVNIKMTELNQRLQEMNTELNRLRHEPVEQYTGKNRYKWLPGLGKRLSKWKNAAKNLERQEKQRDRVFKMEDDVKSRTPLAIQSATTSVLEDLLETCVDLAVSVLEERKKRAETAGTL